MRILVTGATGFIGSALCRELCRDGHTVAAGLGDGSIQFLKQVKIGGNKKKAKMEWETLWRVDNAHTWVVADL